MKALKFSLLLLFPFTGSAQGYVSFPYSGVTWVNTLMYLDWDIWGMPNYEIVQTDNYCANGDDTLIGSFTYTKLHLCNSAYQGAFRDNGGQVFYVPADSLQEYLIYDFTANTGDTVWNVYLKNAGGFPEIIEYYVVQQIDSILIQGDYRRVITLFDSGQWIEGIGNPQGLLNETWSNVSDYAVNLHCMSHTNLILWPDDGTGTCALDVGLNSSEIKAQVYPNPSSGKFSVSFGVEPVLTISVFNAMGQLIQPDICYHDHAADIDLTSFSKGIYLIQVALKDEIQYVKIIKE